MDIRLWQELVLYRRRVYHYNEKYIKQGSLELTIDSIIELTLIIPDSLISGVRVKLLEFITIENNFNDIIDYLNWLDSVIRVVENKEFFKSEQYHVLVDHRKITLSEFLTDTDAMLYFPAVILENIRSKLMKLQKALNKIDKESDLYDYYPRLLSGFSNMMAQPVLAIGEVAGLNYG